jgi:phosphoglycolate phosphatase-like HAD superfamily hydrolase
MPIDSSRVEAVCFDVDGTLSDTDDHFVQRMVKWLTPMRYFFRGHDVHRTGRRLVMFTEGPGNWAFGLADKLGLDDNIIAVGDRFYEMGIAVSDQPFQLIEGVREMLVNLRDHYLLSIISARGKKSTYKFLFQYELLPYFSAVATGQTCVHTKPYPDPLEWAAVQMGVPPASCLMVGDTVVDILTGKKAGAQTVGVLCGFGVKNELELAGADLILENTSDLVGHLIKSK